MHSLAWSSHQRGMYLTGCQSPQSTVLSISCFGLLPCGVPSPSPIRQLFCPFHSITSWSVHFYGGAESI